MTQQQPASQRPEAAKPSAPTPEDPRQHAPIHDPPVDPEHDVDPDQQVHEGGDGEVLFDADESER